MKRQRNCSQGLDLMRGFVSPQIHRQNTIAIGKDPSVWKPSLWAAYFECRGALESRLRQEMAGGIVGFAGVIAMLTKFCGSPQSRRLEGEWRS